MRNDRRRRGQGVVYGGNLGAELLSLESTATVPLVLEVPSSNGEDPGPYGAFAGRWLAFVPGPYTKGFVMASARDVLDLLDSATSSESGGHR